MIILLMVVIILKTKFLINDFCIKFKKNLVVGAISKFDAIFFHMTLRIKTKHVLDAFIRKIVSQMII